MERLYKYLQITVLVVALLAPSIYSVGYAYDWGYLDGFAIEHPLFFKVPQEYLGLAVVVIVVLFAKILGTIFVEHIGVVSIAIAMLAVLTFALRYLIHHPKLWSKFYLRYSNWRELIRGKIRIRIFESLASAYLVSTLPVLFTAGIAYLFLLVISPGLIGYGKGQEAAKKFKDEWRSETCMPKNKMLGCTQILDAGKVIATGKLVVASEKYVAIYDGSSVQIYTLRNRDVKTILSVPQK